MAYTSTRTILHDMWETFREMFTFVIAFVSALAVSATVIVALIGLFFGSAIQKQTDETIEMCRRENGTRVYTSTGSFKACVIGNNPVTIQ